MSLILDGKGGAMAREEGVSAIDLLKADHEKVKGLFEEFESAEEDSRKEELCILTLRELIVHDMIEEELLYPAMRGHLEDEMVDEAGEEHHVLKFLITELAQMKPDHEKYDARYKVMSELVKHHIEEEEGEMFPEFESSGVDLVELGGRIARRKEEILSEGVEPAEWAKKPGAVEGVKLVRGGSRNAGRSSRSRSRGRSSSKKKTLSRR